MDEQNYIGVAMGLDVTDLKAGITEANKQIQLANSKFKAASSGMDDWTKSADGLTAKIEQLDTVLSMQKKKLAGLQAEYEKVSKEQGENSEAARRLAVQINNQQASVNRTEKEFKNYKATLEGVENGSIDLEKVTLRAGKAVEKSGKQVEDAGDGFTVAKGAVATFVGNALTGLVNWAREGAAALLELSESTREYRTDMGILNSNADRMGVSTKTTGDAMKYLSGIIDETDSSVEGLSNLLQAGFKDNNLGNAVETLSNAIVAFPDTLKIESLSDSLQESIQQMNAGNNATGQYAELLERLGYNLDTVTEEYSGLSSAEKKQAYLLELVNKKIGGTAKNYRDQNAALVQAKEEQFEYNDTLAELGETLEPVNQEINQLKVELAKEFAPVLKKEVVPATREFMEMLDDADAVEKAGKAVGFLVENVDDIARVTVTAMGVWKTFAMTMAITNTVTATSKAIKGLTEATTLATKAQIALNAAQKANLFGAIASLAVTAIAGIATYALTAKDGEKATDLLTDSQRDAVTTAQDLAEAYKKTKEEARKLAEQDLANLDYTERLWKELQTLADKNGVVKKGYEDRANFILTELNKALGTEHTMNGNIIKDYGDMKKSIEDVILAKRAQILMTAHEESYKQAIENVAAAEKARAIQVQELAAQEEVVRQKELEYNKLREESKRALTHSEMIHYERSLRNKEIELEREKGILAEKQGEYNKTEDVLFGYYSDIASYEKASTLIMQGETAKAVQYLDELASNFKTVASTAELGADQQKKVLEQQVIDTEINARLMKEAYEDGVDGVTKEMVDTAKEQADKAKTEFQKVGGEITKGIAEGAEEEEWTLTGAMESLITKGLDAAKKAAGIESPSKLFRDEIGKYIGEGVGVGVLASIPEVKKDVQKFNDFLTESIGEDGVAGLSADISTSGGSIRRATNPATIAGNSSTSKSTVVDARMTVNYNGHLSRKELKRLENDNYAAIRTKLKAEGAI